MALVVSGQSWRREATARIEHERGGSSVVVRNCHGGEVARMHPRCWAGICQDARRGFLDVLGIQVWLGAPGTPRAVRATQGWRLEDAQVDQTIGCPGTDIVKDRCR